MRGNGLSIPSKDLVKEINALKAQLKRVSDAVATDASDGVNQAMDAFQIFTGKEPPRTVMAAAFDRVIAART